MAQIAEMTFLNSTLRIISGQKYSRLIIHLLLQGTDTLRWSTKDSSTFLVGTTGLIEWTTFISTVLTKANGLFRMYRIRKLGLVQGILTAQSSIIINFIFSEAMMGTIETICIDLTLPQTSGSRSEGMVYGPKADIELQQQLWVRECTCLVDMMAQDS